MVNNLIIYLRQTLFEAQFTIMIILICADIVTGILVGIFEKSTNTQSGKIESKFFRKSILRKVGYLILYYLTVFICFFIGDSKLSNLCTTLLIATDGLSIIENLGLLGVPIPKFLRTVLGQLKSKGDSENEDNK